MAVPSADYEGLWQDPDMGQHPQFPPQEDFPCFLSFLSRMMIHVIRPIRTRLTRIVPALSMIACNINSHFLR